MTKEQEYNDFRKYEMVRRGGNYNMITQWEYAAKEAGLSRKQYSNIIKRYSTIKNHIEKDYGSVDNFLK